MGRIIGITGQMATGKSRLAGTFAEYLAARGVAARILSIDSIRRYLMPAAITFTCWNGRDWRRTVFCRWWIA